MKPNASRKGTHLWSAHRAAFPRAHRRHYRLRLDAETLETRRLLSGSSSAVSPTLDAYSQNPLSFEPNVGQTSAQVQFLSQGLGYSLFLNSQQAVLSLLNPSATSMKTAPPAAPSSSAVVQMALMGANPAAKGTGLDKLPGVSNYMDGGTPGDWLTNIPNYAQVEYQDVYPGVNLVYIGNQQQLEFNFELAAGADPSVIAMSFQGVDSLALDSAGDLALKTAGGNVTEQAPVVYQEIDGVKQIVAGSFVLEGQNQVGFKLGPYDHSQPLVIDPVVVYSTYLGGSSDDYGTGIAVDSSGNTYVTGYSRSTDFPPSPSSSLNPAFLGTAATETFVTKFNPSGQIIASTFLGSNPTGSQSNYNGASSIGVDGAGNVYITGFADYGTLAAPFPTTLAPFPNPGGQEFELGAYVAELDPTLSTLVYSTYLGSGVSGSNDEPVGIAVDAAGDAYVAGNVEDILEQVYATGPESLGLAPFVARLSPSGAVVFDEPINPTSVGTLSSYFLNANGNEATGVAIDPEGNAYVVGSCDSNTFGSAVAPLAANPAGYDVFVLKVNANGAQQYLVQVGGVSTNATPSDSNYDLGLNQGSNYGNAIAVDAAGDAYVTGTTDALDFPTVNAFQSTFHGGTAPVTSGSTILASTGTSAFAFKLNPAGTQLLYSTYLGGSGTLGEPSLDKPANDFASGIAIDGAGDAYITGGTNSVDFPRINATQFDFGSGDEDAFVSELNAAGSGLIYSTFYSGTGADERNSISVYDSAAAIAVDPNGNAYITGATTSSDFPPVNAAQSTFGGGLPEETATYNSLDDQYPPDAFVVKFARDLAVTAQKATFPLGQSFTALVATFTAPNPILPTSNYRVGINWGDGTTSVTTDVVQPQPGGPYQVYATHTYTTLGAFPLRVSVTDNTYGLTAYSVSNVSQEPGDGNSPSIAVDPMNANDVFEIANAPDLGVLASYSRDGGQTWTAYSVGGTDTGTSLLYPSAVFDKFGNLYVAALLENQSNQQDFVQLSLSADDGATFRLLATFPLPGITGAAGLTGNQNVELRPSLATGPAGAGNPAGATGLWVMYYVPGETSAFYVAAAVVTGKASDDENSNTAVGTFEETQVASAQFGSTGDLAIGPTGQAAVVWQNIVNNGKTSPYPPGAFLISTNSSGLQDIADFSPPLVLTPTPTLINLLPRQQNSWVNLGVGRSPIW